MKAARAAAVAGLAAVVAIGLWRPAGVMHGYLAGYLLVLGVPVGLLAIGLVHRLTGGRWGGPVAGAIPLAASALPVMAVLFVPVALDLEALFPWARPDAVAASPGLQHRRPYLNPVFFLVRAALLFALWTALARWSDRGRGHAGVAAGGLVAWTLAGSFAVVDWVGSLEQGWYSTVLGMYVLAGFVLTALAAVTLRATRPGRSSPPDVLADLGNLLLTMVSVHAYLAFSQAFLIWNGNLPHEIVWYLSRVRGGWGVVGWVLVAIHFALPFAVLLSRATTRSAGRLRAVATTILVARALETAWLVLPSWRGDPWPAVAAAAATAAGCAGVAAAVAAGRARRVETAT